ncbi:ABC transporter permease [Pseudogemmobacter sonorensis]|uniref:ABC transporter permease n=1 Tax=Pseudogemmobacter sonorensis TaxID=2989681 RepID=UPI00367D1AAA
MSEQARTPNTNRRFRMARTVLALVLREISTSYGRTAIGYLWAFIEPVAGILLLTIVFMIVAHSPPMGTSFSYFYASGLLPFFLYMDISGKIASALRFSQPLLFYPGVTFIDAIVARLLLNGLTQLIVMTTILAGIILMERLDVILDLPALLVAVMMAICLGLGVGTLNSFLTAVFPVWERIWAILNRPLLLVSCTFFTFESVPSDYAKWLWFNPIVHIVGKMRQGLFPSYDGAYVSPLYVFWVGLLTTCIGLVMLSRYRSYILNDG